MIRAFRIRHEDNGTVTFLPISNIDGVMLDDLLGYEKQKQELRRNTETFLAGKRANNVLLYGDAGTGKSTSVKALINEYFDRGLRMIEIYKHQFQDLSAILAQIKNRNYRFIIFIDDLSFEENEVEYKFLKAVIEGGVETRPDNVLIYATSNRRHLIRETWNDRTDMEHHGDIHRSDTVEEKLSLASRFGVAINYNAPTQKEYQEIVRTLAARQGITAGPVFRSRNGQPMRRTQVTGEIRSLCRDARVPEEKGNPRCLRRLWQKTQDAIRISVDQLVVQAFDQMMEAEQFSVGWDAGKGVGMM